MRCRIICERNRIRLAALSSLLLSLTACIGAACAQSSGEEVHKSTLPEWLYVVAIGALVMALVTVVMSHYSSLKRQMDRIESKLDGKVDDVICHERMEACIGRRAGEKLMGG